MKTRLAMLSGMANALRLVRAGQLRQALLVIQEGLHGHAEPSDARPVNEAPIDVRPANEAPIDVRPAGAAPAAPPRERFEARFESHSYTNHAGTRDYKLYVPAACEGEALPLLVMLHGCTQSPDDFAAGTRMNELAAEHGFFVAYPAQASSANPNRCWNWFKRTEQQRELGEPSLIAGIVSAVKARHAIDDRRIYIAGLSSGGAMAATLAATYPDLIAAVGVHSGLAHGCAHDLQSGLDAMRSGSAGVAVTSVPTIVFHGDRDRLVHPRNGEELVAQRLSGNPAAAMSVDPVVEMNGYSYTRRSACAPSGQPLVEHWVIHGAGHAWSGGSPRGTHTDPRGPDASSEMLRFFLACAAV